jgi:hypothetical protein
MEPVLENAPVIYHHWQNVCTDILLDDFHNWAPMYEIDLQLGNPIYSLYQIAANKGIRIIHDRTGERFGMHMRKSGTTEMVEDHVDELVIDLAWNSYATEIFKIIFRVWINPDTSLNYMQDFISRSK